ncbi:hypothetical protein [Lactiplantibacillus herbarum]|uniref:hypothetical protein n=1 Tax=Lactiplantibacillus herbarum TaxID=1670446 RepID=UPI00064FC2E3|nr:hypothetical protein [Lactiplantibacillus herbarum]
MNNQSHDELTSIVQTELTQLASVVQPTIKAGARKVRRMSLICFAFAIIVSVILAQEMTSTSVISSVITVILIAYLLMLGIRLLLLGSQKAIIARNTKSLVYSIENHLSNPTTFNVSSPDRIILTLKSHNYYLKPNELHLTNTNIEHYHLVWMPSYHRLFKNRLRTPIIFYCDAEKLKQFEQVLSPDTAIKVSDN